MNSPTCDGIYYCDITGKRCFSKREAGEMIRMFKRNRKWKNRGKTIPERSYYCSYCGTFHVTHFKSRPRKMPVDDLY